MHLNLSPLPPARSTAFKQRSSGRLTNLIDLLQGRFSKEILADLTHRDTGLFPAPSEIKMSCSCPDWAGMCKHLAAVLYGVGARLDEKPELFFTLRGVDVAELIASATHTAARDPVGGTALVGNALDGEDLSALFGVELDSGTPPVPTPPPTPPNIPAKPPRAPAGKPPVSKTRPGSTKAPGKPASGMKSKPPAKTRAARAPITSSPGKAPTSAVATPKPPGKSRTRKQG